MNFQNILFSSLFSISAIAAFVAAVDQSSQCGSACSMTTMKDFVNCKKTECTSSDCYSSCSEKMKKTCTGDVDPFLWDCTYSCVQNMQMMCQALLDTPQDSSRSNSCIVATGICISLGLINLPPIEVDVQDFVEIGFGDSTKSLEDVNNLNAMSLTADILALANINLASPTGAESGQSGDCSQIASIIIASLENLNLLPGSSSSTSQACGSQTGSNLDAKSVIVDVLAAFGLNNVPITVAKSCQPDYYTKLSQVLYDVLTEINLLTSNSCQTGSNSNAVSVIAAILAGLNTGGGTSSQSGGNSNSAVDFVDSLVEASLLKGSQSNVKSGVLSVATTIFTIIELGDGSNCSSAVNDSSLASLIYAALGLINPAGVAVAANVVAQAQVA